MYQKLAFQVPNDLLDGLNTTCTILNTLGYQAFKAARTKPAITLKYE